MNPIIKKSNLVILMLAFLLLSSKLVFADDKMLANAVIAQSEMTFTTLCIVDKSIGLNWENNQWVQRDFINEKYIIQKIGAKSTERTPFMCREKMQSPTVLNKIVQWENCYNIRKSGELFDGAGELCYEQWMVKNDKYILINIQCSQRAGSDFNLSPNGAFNKSITHQAITDNGDVFGDSLSLSVGKCSVMINE